MMAQLEDVEREVDTIEEGDARLKGLLHALP
jgi:hypothetical protein